MGKGRPNRQAGGTGEEGGTFRSLLGQPAFWAVVNSFIKHGWHLLRVQPAVGFMSKCSVKVCRKERGQEERKRVEGKNGKNKRGSKGNRKEEEGRKRDW